MATTESDSLSLHDALPISLDQDQFANAGVLKKAGGALRLAQAEFAPGRLASEITALAGDRKSTRLNSSHVKKSYAVFCLKKKSYHVRRCSFRAESCRTTRP